VPGAFLSYAGTEVYPRTGQFGAASGFGLRVHVFLD